MASNVPFPVTDTDGTLLLMTADVSVALFIKMLDQEQKGLDQLQRLQHSLKLLRSSPTRNVYTDDFYGK